MPPGSVGYCLRVVRRIQNSSLRATGLLSPCGRSCKLGRVPDRWDGRAFGSDVQGRVVESPWLDVPLGRDFSDFRVGSDGSISTSGSGRTVSRVVF